MGCSGSIERQNTEIGSEMDSEGFGPDLFWSIQIIISWPGWHKSIKKLPKAQTESELKESLRGLLGCSHFKNYPNSRYSTLTIPW